MLRRSDPAVRHIAIMYTVDEVWTKATRNNERGPAPDFLWLFLFSLRRIKPSWIPSIRNCRPWPPGADKLIAAQNNHAQS